MWVVALEDTNVILWSWCLSPSTVVFDCLWPLGFLSPSHCSINFVYLIFRIFFVNYADNSWAMWTTIWYIISYKDGLIVLWLLHRKISCGVVRAWNQWLNLKKKMLPNTYVLYMWHYSVSFKIWLIVLSFWFHKVGFIHLENNRIIRCLLISSSERREIIHIFLTQNGPRLVLICGS